MIQIQEVVVRKLIKLLRYSALQYFILSANIGSSKQSFIFSLQAIKKGEVDAVENWLSRHDVNSKFSDSKQQTPLHLAAQENKPDIMSKLLDHGAGQILLLLLKLMINHCVL